MATQIFESNLSSRLPRSADQSESPDWDSFEEEEQGSVFRGFFYAMLFNVLLLATGAAGWELWRLLR
jgi:hypothetical protein